MPQFVQSHGGVGQLTNTPLVDALAACAKLTNVSFHALPIGRERLLEHSKFAKKYQIIFENRLTHEVTITSPFFDTFIAPDSFISQAEALCAQAFDADDTLFVTGGSTLANQIVIDALVEGRSTRVLVDKGCHQSIHFSLDARGAETDYVNQIEYCRHSERSALDLETLVGRLRQAEMRNRPYDLVILNGQSYDGTIQDITAVTAALIEASPSLHTIYIDEAWGAWCTFHPVTRRHTTMAAARTLSTDCGITFVATHSAHKSLNALRQASYIHVTGSAAVAERLRMARYRLHTTSPSYAILASLDLARAQMVEEGEAMIGQCIALAQTLCGAIRTDPELHAFGLNPHAAPAALQHYVHIDPTKVSLRILGLSLTAAQLRERLFQDHGIYVSRCTSDSVLLNVHIGVTGGDIELLLAALRNIQKASLADSAAPARSKAFIISYPPGVPLVVPGETINREKQRELEMKRSTGVKLITVEGKLENMGRLQDDPVAAD